MNENKIFLGKYSGVPVYTILNNDDIKQEVDLNDLSINVKKAINNFRKRMSKSTMTAFICPYEYNIARDEYFRMIRLKTSIINNRSIENTEFLQYLLAILNVNSLKQVCRDFKLKGYSGLKKDKIIEFISDSLSDDEIKEYIEENEMDLINSEFAKGVLILNGNAKEKLQGFKVISEKEGEIELGFKGFNWDSIISTAIHSNTLDNPFRTCDCNIGNLMGFCSHFWVAFLKSYELGFFNISDWKLTLIPNNFDSIYRSLKNKNLLKIK